MDTATRLVRLVLLYVLCWLLAACGAPPTIRQSQVLAANHDKATRLQFIYRNMEMYSVSTASISSVAVADTGFSGFGELLVKQAQAAFAHHQVAVTGAWCLDGKRQLAPGMMRRVTDGGMPPVLVLTPASGRVQANGRATSTSYVFKAHLLELGSHRLLWAATVDTRTWSGQNAVLKHMQKTLFDEAYADQLLKAVADRMKDDGII